MDYSKAAKETLEGHPFTVKYLGIKNDKEYVCLLQEEYPNYIPNAEEWMIIDEETYAITSKFFLPQENEVRVILQTYSDWIKNQKNHKI